MKKNTIVRHCFSRKYISLCIFLLLGIIGEKAFAYSVWETYANETEGIYFSLQESIKITGVVKDNKGEPIIGANIVELNKKGNGTITDIDGKFTLSVSKNAEISISFIGFDEKKIKIGQQTSFDIILEESSQFLDEVVVVGMNNRQTRRSVTGAISTIQTKELKQSPVANLSNALAGKLPGLITVQTSGQPGEDASSLFIRGAYHYFIPKTDARKQADFFIRTVQLAKGDLPPVLDVETTGKQSPQELKTAVKTWLDRVEAHYGVKPILYTSYKFKKRYLSDSIFNAYPYWIAHYYVDSVRYEGKWHFWQHTDVGTVPGIEEEVDLNVFNGTMEELLELTLKTPCIER